MNKIAWFLVVAIPTVIMWALATVAVMYIQY